VNARAELTVLIASARRSLHVEDEEMYDTASEDALIAAARRGVEVDVMLPPPSGSSGNGDAARLLAGGVHVRYLDAPYMHAKLLVADGTLMFVGSENFSSRSLDENREVGIVIADPQAVATIGTVYAQDWALARPA
jgi:cardiolipin synthase A/B